MRAYELKIPGKTSHLAKVREWILKLSNEAGLNALEAADLEMAVNEAVTNIIVHTYNENRCLPHHKKEVLLEGMPVHHGLEIKISDHGQYFNLLESEALDVDRHAAALKTHGFGIYAIKEFVSQIEHQFMEGQGNVLILRKFSAH